VIPDSNAQREAKRLPEPIIRLTHVRIRELWNDRAPWDGPIRAHPSSITPAWNQ
jgi:hypothetical protein